MMKLPANYCPPLGKKNPETTTAPVETGAVGVVLIARAAAMIR